MRHTPNNTQRLAPRSGFALMIALMLMVFLVLLMTSLTSLVRVDFQTANAANSQSLARQNALLGLQIALAQLQEHTGSDARITAQSAILDTGPEDDPSIANQHWTGVWKQNSAGDGTELVTWLVSGNQSLTPTDSDFVTPDNVLGNNESVQILGSGTTSADAVRAPTVAVQNGNFAYWVSEQQTKALINIGNETVTSATPALPDTISSRHLFPHLSLSVKPEDSTNVSKTLTFAQVGHALDLPEADKQRLNNYYHDLTVNSNGLLTDAKNGGLKTDLSALLSHTTLPAAYNGKPIYEAATEIRSDALATQSPTWDYLKSYYDLRLEVLGSGGITPRPATPDTHGISPVIAAFSYGFGGGLEAVAGAGTTDYRIIVNLYPQLVLYNPYNVTLKARDYVLVLLGNQALRQEASFGNNEFRYMPIAEGRRSSQFYTVTGDSFNYELGKSFTHNAGDSTISDLNQRTDKEGSGQTPRNDPPGAPRFLVEAPDILPGQAVIFTPAQQMDYDRYAVANEKLTQGFRPHSFRWHTISYLKENTAGGPALDFIRWNLHGATYGTPVYLDAALLEPGYNGDLLRSDTTGVQRHLNRRDEDTFRNRVFQTTGRIPSRRPSPIPTTATYYHGIENLNPGTEFGWAAYAFTPTNSFQTINTRPYIHFNPRAKDLDPRNIRNSNGDNQHHFYSTYAGNSFPVIETYDNNRKVYIGGDYTRDGGGRESFILYDVPLDETGLYSLGQLQHMQTSEHFDEPGYAIGNSWASPHIERDAFYKRGAGVTSSHSSGYIGDMDYSVVDTSYLLNNALWDRYFFSTIRNIGQSGNATMHTPMNPRYRFTGNLTTNETFSNEATNAAQLLVNGAFNVNSTSITAWQAILSGLHAISLNGNTLNYPFFRSPHPTGTSSDPWTGFRELTDTQIEALAKAIVQENKSRGPSLSLGAFVNRRLVAKEDDPHGHGLKGALQAAIDRTDINNSMPGTGVMQSNTLPFAEPEHVAGSSGATTADGIPGFLSQADILSAIGPLLAVRSDTFVIRSYGDALNPVTKEIESMVWCEAVVQRTYDYVNPEENNPHAATESLSNVNTRLGRNYKIVSFRWLSNDEI